MTETPSAPTGPDAVRRAVADAHRREWAYVLAATVRVAGDLDLAEECVQDAFLTALETWSARGVPDSPGGWLTIAARRRALDRLRRETTLRRKLPLLVEPVGDPPASPIAADLDGGSDVIPDDRLRLVFTCAHPALSSDGQVALTLRLVCGLTTPEIARVCLVSEATMAARVTRAKKKIVGAQIPFRTPAAHELPDRLDAVLRVVHLLFTTGHTAPTGDRLVRPELVDRALDLARMLHALMPDEPAVRGLLALLLLTDARRATRTDAAGRLVLLRDQDRSAWDRAAIDEGRALVASALRGGRGGRYAVQAAIAALHAEASSYAETDWRQIVQLYDVLLARWPSPVVALNRAVALGEAEGAAAGLAALDRLVDDPQLDGYPYLAAARADLLRRVGRPAEAAAAYRAALALTANAAEADFLTERLGELDA